MAIDPNAFNALQAQSVAEKRRITIDEFASIGGDPNEYWKIYGVPDNDAFARASQYYGSKGLRIPTKDLLAMGINPVEVPKVYGDPPARNIQDLLTQDEQRTRSKNDILAQGTRGSGDQFGQAQQINAAVLPDAPLMQAANIAPVATVNDLQLGDIERANASTIDPTSQVSLENAFRAKQQALANELEATARGDRPSLAELQLKESTDRNNAQAMGLIASQRGVNAGLATRLAMNQVGDANQEAVMKGSQLRLAEAIAARQELATLSNQARGQDAAIQTSNAQAVNARAATQAQLNQQISQYNAEQANARAVAQGDLSTRLALANQLAINNQNTTQAQLTQQANQLNQQTKYNTNVQQGTLTQGANIANQGAVNTMESTRAQTAAGVKQAGISAGATVGAANASAAGQVQAAEIRADADVFNNTLNNATALTVAGAGIGSTIGQNTTSTNNANAQNNQQTAASGASALSTIGLTVLSDERKKEAIKDADSEIERFLSALEAKKYNYKDGDKEGRGKKVGVMAQDLEETAVGNSFVKDTPEGKKVDYGQGLGAMMASLASLNKRLQSLEGRA